MDDTLTYARYPFADGSGCDHDRDRPAGDDPRRRRGRREPGRPALRATRSARRSSCPVVGRRVPVIADERVEPEFGSGALKITPGHDPIDFEIGRDHGLRDAHRDRPRRPHDRATASRGSTQAEADERVVDWLERARPAREARALPALGRHVRALPLADRAARLAAVVVPRWTSSRARRSRRSRRAASATTPRASTASRSSRSSRRPTGASRASSGGATRSRSGRARTATRRRAWPPPRRLRRVRLGRARARDRRPRHVVLLGALAVRDARLARARRPSSSATTRATSTSPRARSSASGRTG